MLLNMLLIDLLHKYLRQPAGIKHCRQTFVLKREENLIPRCLTLCSLRTKNHSGINFKGFSGSLATTNASGIKLLEAYGTGKETEHTSSLDPIGKSSLLTGWKAKAWIWAVMPSNALCG